MALPETTNNVTTRRLGTALSALWDKTAATYVKKAGDTMTGRLTMEQPLSQLITGTGVVGSASGSTRYPSRWLFDLGIATPNAGDQMVIKIPCAGHNYGVWISTDNGTTYFPVARNTGTTRLTTHHAAGAYICVVFETYVSGNTYAGAVDGVYPVTGATASINPRIGCWRIINDYDSGNTYDRLWGNDSRFYAGATGCNPYSLMCLDSDGKFSMLVSSGSGTGTSKTINTNGKFKLNAVIFYYGSNSSASANGLVPNTQVYSAFPNLDTRHSHNHTDTFATNSPLYIECTIDDDGYWSPTTKCITQTLETGKYYIYLGQTSSTEYQLSLSASHPLYYYDGTNLTERPRLNKEDRTKLDGISDGANKVEASQTNGNIKIDGTETNVYTHPTTSGNKHIPSGGSSGQFLGWDSDGTAKWVNSPDTDTKVTQTADNSSTGTGFEVLFSATGDNTTRTETSKKSNKLTFQPSTGTLTATKFSGPLEGNASSASTAASGSALETAINSKAASDHTHSVKINGSTKTIAASGGTAVDLGYYVQYNNATQGLSDTYKSNARTNIGLGTAAVKDVPSSGNASTTQVVLGSDTRLSDARTPTNHASADTNFGLGTTSVYGHVKLATGDMNGADNVDGVAVSKNHTHSQYQLASDRVTSWSSTTTDAHYPSEKLVKTALDSKVPGVYVTGSIDASSTRYVKMSIPTDGLMRHYIITLNMSMAAWHDEWLFKTYNVGGTTRTSVSYLGYTSASHKWYGSDGADFYIEINNTSAASQSYKFSVAAIDLSTLPTLSKVDTLPEGFTEMVVTGTIAEKLRVARQLSVDLSSTSTTNTTFDGSANVSIKNTGTLPVTKGGTGKTSVTAAEYNLLSHMGTELTGEMNNDRMFAFAYSTQNEANGRLAGYRKASTVWSWIKGKLASDTNVDISGHADSATYDGNGNTISDNSVYYVVGTTDYPAWQANHAYVIGDNVVANGQAYTCKTAHTSGSSFSTTNWNAMATPVIKGTVNNVSALFVGMKIALKWPIRGGSSSTYLNINGLGNVYIRKNDTINITSHFPATTVTFLAYDGTYWRWADYDSNSTYNGMVTAYVNNAGDAAKSATSTNFKLTDGITIILTNNAANTKAAALTLNVNSTGAKALYINGEISSSTNYTIPIGTYFCHYTVVNGTGQWHLWTDGTVHFKGLHLDTPLPDTEIASAATWNAKEDASNKVSSWSSTTTNAHYPTEKLVKDSLDSKSDSTHTHGLQHSDFTCSVPNYDSENPDDTWLHNIGLANLPDRGYWLKSLRTATEAPPWLVREYASGIAFGGYDTKGVMSVGYRSPFIKFAGGNSYAPQWWVGIKGTSGKTYTLPNVSGSDITLQEALPTVSGTSTYAISISGNAGTATDLASGSVLSVSKGGTGKSSVTNSNFLVGAGTGALVEKTPAEVLALIGAQAALTEMTTTEVTDFVSALGEL